MAAIMNIYSTIILSMLFISITSCQKEPDGIDHVPEKIIFDTDMGSDCDDAGALALLHAYADQGRAEIVGCIYSSGRVPYGAAVVEAINIYYGRGYIPVGASHNDEVGDPVDKMTAEKLARDTAAFHHTIIHNQDAREQTKLSRSLLAGEEDGSITYLTVGHTRGLYDLLVSGPDEISPLSGAELIDKKIKRWVALGALGADNPDQQYRKDWNFFFNNTAPYTKYLIENFPSPVYFVNGGSKVMTGKSLKTTSPGNIVRTAYRDWLWSYDGKTLDDQRPSWDLVTVYYAVEGSGDYFNDPVRGRLEFDPEKGCRWHSGAEGKDHFYINQKPGTDTAFSEYLNRMIARTPAYREIPK